MRILVTAGPTREPLDPVRYLSNRSTGAMGAALAEAALERGHDVTVVLGPASVPAPAGADVRPVETAREMLAATLDALPSAGAVVCAAAVCDLRPARVSGRKLKRGTFDTIELVENPDIAAEVGRRKEGRPLAVFALETEDGEERARNKLEAKNADWCVLNAPAAIGASSADFTLVSRTGEVRPLGDVSKLELSRTLLEALGV